jgi:ubiquinone/menaquinone biosynthesis C-methylase UbiE
MPGHPIFARLYDRMLAKLEREELGELRRALLSDATGRTLEIGAGTGHNLPYYPEAVTELVLAEPDPHMARRLRERLQREPPAIEKVSVIEAPAEDLPFDDASFETVVSTLVLCTVQSPIRAVAEAKRVLGDDGALLFLEHIRSESPRLARVQDVLERPWGFFAGGCHPNRATAVTIAGAGMWVERLQKSQLEKAGPLVRPIVSGIARRPSGAAAPEY